MQSIITHITFIEFITLETSNRNLIIQNESICVSSIIGTSLYLHSLGHIPLQLF